MEDNIVKDFEIIKNMKKGKEKGNKIFYIATICIVTLILFSIIVGIENETIMNMIITLGIAEAILLIGYILRNKRFKTKEQEVRDNSKEINEYCVRVQKDLYVTKDSIMYFNGGYSSDFIIKRKDIQSINVMHSSDDDSITIKTINKKSYSLAYSKLLEDILMNRKKEFNKEPEVIPSNYVKNFIMYDGYSEGIVDVPCLNTECGIFVYSSNENSINYAEETAKKIKEFTFDDLKDAITCSVWAFRDYLKEFGYQFLKENEKIPIDVTEDEILKYMELVNVVSDEKGVGFQFEVPWEKEHGFSWVFREKELIYVGTGHDAYPTSSDSTLQGNWNYAKKYHKPVELTEEEKANIKTREI